MTQIALQKTAEENIVSHPQAAKAIKKIHIWMTSVIL